MSCVEDTDCSGSKVCSGGTCVCPVGSSKDCAGECGGSSVYDCGGNCYDPDNAESPTVVEDCLGVCDGNAVNDCGGNCYDPDTGSATVTKDCAGTCGGTAVPDCAGVCGGTTVRDCDGVCGGTSVVDCAGTCYDAATEDPPQVLDCNGACGGTAAVDCAGVCGGDAYLDCGGNCIESNCFPVTAKNQNVSRGKILRAPSSKSRQSRYISSNSSKSNFDKQTMIRNRLPTTVLKSKTVSTRSFNASDSHYQKKRVESSIRRADQVFPERSKTMKKDFTYKPVSRNNRNIHVRNLNNSGRRKTPVKVRSTAREPGGNYDIRVSNSRSNRVVRTNRKVVQSPPKTHLKSNRNIQAFSQPAKKIIEAPRKTRFAPKNN